MVPSFTNDTTSTSAASHRRLTRFESSRRRLAAAPAAAQLVAPGTNVMFRFVKHEGDFVFMSLVGSLEPPTAPPTRKQPPSRTLHHDEIVDYGIFCNLRPGNRYWIALIGGGHCAAYDLEVVQLAHDDTRCASGEYSLVENEVDTAGQTTLALETPTYGSCVAGEYVDYALPLTMAHDFDENLRFQVRGTALRTTPAHAV